MAVILSRKGGGGAGGGAPSGPAGGDLSGTYPNPTLASGVLLFNAYALLRDEKAAGTDAGTFTNGAWRTRELNTESFDPDGIVKLAANQFTLAAGTYFIVARAPAFAVRSHTAKLRDITAGADAIIGSVESTSASFDTTTSIVTGRVSPAVSTVYELQHQCMNTIATNGLGLAANFSVVEIYSEVLIWRET